MYPLATERYIIWHYKTFILEFSYIYLLQALIHVLNLLYFLLFLHHHGNIYFFTISSIVHAVVVIPATFHLYPKAVTTPQFKVSATISPSQSEHFILLATIIGLWRHLQGFEPIRVNVMSLFRDRIGDKMMSLFEWCGMQI